MVFIHMQIIKHPNSELEPTDCYSSGRLISFQESHASSKETEFQFCRLLGGGGEVHVEYHESTNPYKTSSDARSQDLGLPILEAFRQKVRGWLSRLMKLTLTEVN